MLNLEQQSIQFIKILKQLDKTSFIREHPKGTLNDYLENLKVAFKSVFDEMDKAPNFETKTILGFFDLLQLPKLESLSIFCHYSEQSELIDPMLFQILHKFEKLSQCAVQYLGVVYPNCNVLELEGVLKLSVHSSLEQADSLLSFMLSLLKKSPRNWIKVNVPPCLIPTFYYCLEGLKKLDKGLVESKLRHVEFLAQESRCRVMTRCPTMHRKPETRGINLDLPAYFKSMHTLRFNLNYPINNVLKVFSSTQLRSLTLYSKGYKNVIYTVTNHIDSFKNLNILIIGGITYLDIDTDCCDFVDLLQLPYLCYLGLTLRVKEPFDDELIPLLRFNGVNVINSSFKKE